MPSRTITVYEHGALYLDKGEDPLSLQELKALQLFYKEKDFPFYSLLHSGVRFCEYVGVIRVGKLTVEVLPKADRSHDKAHWRAFLIDMLRSAGVFDSKAPSTAQLKIKSNSILEHYFALFITEVEQVLHHGLIKRYRKTQANNTTLKGKLLLGKHIGKNLVHQERFFVEHTVYDRAHLLNQILYKGLNVLRRHNLNPALLSRINNIYLNFPEMKDVVVDEDVFSRIVYDRKNIGYQKAIGIARLLLLNYHPDVNAGQEDVLALMFDMNLLWERFVLKALQRFKPQGLTVSGQTRKDFWKPELGRIRGMKPDIVVVDGEKYVYVIDTKWKNIAGHAASDDDLRQMYAYGKFHDGANVCLFYPGSQNIFNDGAFMHEKGNKMVSMNRCAVMKIVVGSGTGKGQEMLARQAWAFLGLEI